MGDQLLDLAGETENVLRNGKLGPAANLTGSDLAWAAFNLRAARIGKGITDLLRSPGGLDRLEALLQEQQANIYEIAAMSLAFGDVMTALDLCGSALDTISHLKPRAPDEHVADMGDWFAYPRNTSKRARDFHTRRELLPTQLRKWLHDLEADPDWGLLKKCRDPIVHRRFSRALTASDPEQGLTLAKIDLTLSGKADPAKADPEMLRDIGDLIEQLLDFGEYRFQTLCCALQAAYR